MPVVIQSFFDYICPYCYLGEAVLNRVAALTGAEIVRRAYSLRESGSPKTDPGGERMLASWETSIYPMAERLGIAIHRPSRLPLTRLAHEAAAWARHQGQLEPFHRQLFKSYFVDDKDIGDLAVLKEVAWQAGLNPGELEKSLADHQMADEVDEDILIARTYGITFVPTFVIAGQQWQGIQEEEVLVKVVELARSGKLLAETQKLPHLPIAIAPVKR